MVGWLTVGAALIYLCPIAADLLVHSEMTHVWLETLSRGGYYPILAAIAGGAALVATTLGNWIWYQRYDGKL